jgi:hypothetical protein
MNIVIIIPKIYSKESFYALMENIVTNYWSIYKKPTNAKKQNRKIKNYYSSAVLTLKNESAPTKFSKLYSMLF